MTIFNLHKVMTVAAMALVTLLISASAWGQGSRPPTLSETTPVEVSCELGQVTQVHVASGERAVFTFAENSHGLTQVTAIPWRSNSVGNSMMITTEIQLSGQAQHGSAHAMGGGVVLFQRTPEMFGALSWLGSAESETTAWLLCVADNQTLNSGHDAIVSQVTQREITMEGYAVQMGELVEQHFPDFEWHAQFPVRP